MSVSINIDLGRRNK